MNVSSLQAPDGALGMARTHLEQVILPFWLSRGIDDEHGGFFTCFDNRGRERVSTDKYSWSQGRFVWLLSRAARLAREGRVSLDAEVAQDRAERGARFLLEHAVSDDGTCVFLTDRTGTAATTGPDRSVYADLFVAMGLYELAACTGVADWVAPADAILTRAEHDIVNRTAPTPPYPLPDRHTAFGPAMILANVCLERHRAMLSLGADATASGADLTRTVDRMLSHRQPDGTFVEMVPDEGLPTDTLVARHRVPGHAIEGLWVALEATALVPIGTETPILLDSLDALCRSAWDVDHGGLLRFVDGVSGGRPEHPDETSDYDRLVRRTWDTKLWWIHSETTFTTALAAVRHHDQRAADWCSTVWDYTRDTFPGGDDGEEWIQIRDRRGAPLDEVVALPVKDPFHIARNLLQLTELAATG